MTRIHRDSPSNYLFYDKDTRHLSSNLISRQKNCPYAFVLIRYSHICIDVVHMDGPRLINKMHIVAHNVHFTFR